MEYWPQAKEAAVLEIAPPSSSDLWALNNGRLAYIKMGKREKARRDFEEALTIEPGFEQAKRNVANE